jgi:hypothetical protein
MTQTMRCPRCGAEMNHQANKLVEPRTREEVEAGAVVGGIVLAVFACANCGYVDSRREDTGDT